MHMADALLSPSVGTAMWAVSAASIGYSSRKLGKSPDEKTVPLMGVLGALLFAAQMINFSIPATGSSGHLGGGILMAILLGPHAALLTISSVLLVQALFFADGGLLALGCNIFNMAVVPAFVVYPLVFKRIVGRNPGARRIATATMVAAIAGLQLGALGVVLETVFSGVSALPFSTFVLLMQPIHLAIGIVEGFVTACLISFVLKTEPGIIPDLTATRSGLSHPKRLLAGFACAAALTGGILSLYASQDPDGLEWAITQATGKEELKGPDRGVHRALAALQEFTSFLPDYSFPKPASPSVRAVSGANPQDTGNGGTTVAGLLGSLITLALVFLCGLLLKRRNRTG